MNELSILDGYRLKIRSLKDALEELEAKKTSIGGHSFSNTGEKHHGRAGAYFEDYVLKHESLCAELEQAEMEYSRETDRLWRKVEELDNADYADALFYRYICGKSTTEAAQKCGYKSNGYFTRILNAAKREYERRNKNDDENKCEL